MLEESPTLDFMSTVFLSVCKIRTVIYTPGTRFAPAGSLPLTRFFPQESRTLRSSHFVLTFR
jgi:hypothetical protein